MGAPFRGAKMLLISEAQIQQWRKEGYCLVQLPERIWIKAYQKAHEVYGQDRPDPWHHSFGSPNKKFEFPCGIPELDDIVLDEDILDIVEELLECKNLRLMQSDIWCKYGDIDADRGLGGVSVNVFAGDVDKSKKPRGQDSTGFYKASGTNQEQKIHMDYGNNTFVHPPNWHKPESVAAIIYYDDSTICKGGTAVVCRNGDDYPAYKRPYVNIPRYANNPFRLNKDEAEEWFKSNKPDVHEFRRKLYEREQRVEFSPGTMLLYRHDIWHRGTTVNDNTSRRVHNIGWR